MGWDMRTYHSTLRILHVSLLYENFANSLSNCMGVNCIGMTLADDSCYTACTANTHLVTHINSSRTGVIGRLLGLPQTGGICILPKPAIQGSSRKANKAMRPQLATSIPLQRIIFLSPAHNSSSCSGADFSHDPPP